MAFEPEPGLVIRFDFWWKEDARKGDTEGKKDRPCAIILATKPKPDGMRDVVLCPITHAPPQKGDTAVEIPPKMARYLKLDDERSWIKTHQINTVEWPQGQIPYGVVPAFPNQMIFGRLHAELSKKALEQVRENSLTRQLQNVRREHNDPLASSRKGKLEKFRGEIKKRVKKKTVTGSGKLANSD
jgi:mRNA-degrading endonuclease toxin of MazEF toxin-antitoxin module